MLNNSRKNNVPWWKNAKKAMKEKKPAFDVQWLTCSNAYK